MAVTRERDEGRTELEFLKKNLSIKDYALHPENAMFWLGYVHHLHDVDQIVKTELQNLLKEAAVPDFNGATLNWAAIKRHETILNRRLGGPTAFTVWGDIDQKMHQTNDFQIHKFGNVE